MPIIIYARSIVSYVACNRTDLVQQKNSTTTNVWFHETCEDLFELLASSLERRGHRSHSTASSEDVGKRSPADLTSSSTVTKRAPNVHCAPTSVPTQPSQGQSHFRHLLVFLRSPRRGAIVPSLPANGQSFLQACPLKTPDPIERDPRGFPREEANFSQCSVVDPQLHFCNAGNCPRELIAVLLSHHSLIVTNPATVNFINACRVGNLCLVQLTLCERRRLHHLSAFFHHSAGSTSTLRSLAQTALVATLTPAKNMTPPSVKPMASRRTRNDELCGGEGWIVVLGSCEVGPREASSATNWPDPAVPSRVSSSGVETADRSSTGSSAGGNGLFFEVHASAEHVPKSSTKIVTSGIDFRPVCLCMSDCACMFLYFTDRRLLKAPNNTVHREPNCP